LVPHPGYRPDSDREAERSESRARPVGLLLVASEGGDLRGCAGLRLVPGHAGNLAEVTRVYVVPAARGRGLGARLLTALEEHARELGVTTLRLDTRKDLTEARRLYARHGYREVAPFNDEKYAEHWFARTITADATPATPTCCARPSTDG
jgi:GNAT superfamily N-acetyltransferase